MKLFQACFSCNINYLVFVSFGFCSLNVDKDFSLRDRAMMTGEFGSLIWDSTLLLSLPIAFPSKINSFANLNYSFRSCCLEFLTPHSSFSKSVLPLCFFLLESLKVTRLSEGVTGMVLFTKRSITRVEFGIFYSFILILFLNLTGFLKRDTK